MNKLYSVHDHWTDINKKNDVDIESIDGVITGIKVNGEDYGGGTSWTEVFSGDVVTSGEAAPFSGTINAVLSGADTIKVFYNDGVYILPKQVTDDGIFYGANPSGYPDNIDFSEIPFLIKLGEVSTALYTQSAGPQDITILEPQSGGGESDFSTAEVTVVNRDEETWLFFLPFAYSSDDLALVGVQGEVGPNETKTFDAILATDGCDFVMQPSFNGSLAVTGDAQKYGSMVAITGDCTITISATA